MDFEYDDNAVDRADRNANRINESGPYIGKINRAMALESEGGAAGVTLEFETVEGGQITFDTYMVGKEGQDLFGKDIMMGLAYLLGAKGFKGESGTVSAWVNEGDKRIKAEVQGVRYPTLEGKLIGIFLQKEVSTYKGKNQEKMTLFGSFDPTTKLTSTELKNRKTKPEAYAKMLKNCKDRDNRKADKAEPAQPGIGGDGGY